MKRLNKILAIVLLSAMGVFSQSVWDGTTAHIAWYNNNMEKDTFYIANANELAGFAQLVNSGFTLNGKTIILTTDIDLGNRNWTPIGSIREFRGVFDGNGHTICNLFVSGTWWYAGLFGRVTGINSQIKNLTVNVSAIKTDATTHSVYAGGLAGSISDFPSQHAIENCIVNIRDSIYANGAQYVYVGGLVGSGTISNSRASGKVSASTIGRGVTAYAGGLVGASSRIIDSYATVNVFAVGSQGGLTPIAGGLVGFGGSVINNSYASGNVFAFNGIAGGLIGLTSGGRVTINNSYATGNVSAQFRAGGLIGDLFITNNSAIINSYASGIINSSSAGGIFGHVRRLDIGASITNTAVYYNSAGASSAIGSGVDASIGIFARTFAQLRQRETFVGRDFNSVWNISPTINNGYPYLRYFTEFVAVRNISGIPTEIEYDGISVKTIEFNGNVEPSNATNKNIVWSLDSGMATLQGNNLTFISAGIVKLKATIINGLGGSRNYEQIFTIKIGNIGSSIHKIKKSDKRHGIRFAVNPVSDKAEISVILPDNERAVETKIVVYDMTGNVVHSGASTGSPTGGAIVWDLRNSAGRFVANGTYLVIAEVKERSGRTHTYSSRLGVKR